MFTFSEFDGIWTMTCNDVTLISGSLCDVDELAGRLIRAGLMPREVRNAFRVNAGITDHPIFGVHYPDAAPRSAEDEAALRAEWSAWVD